MEHSQQRPQQTRIKKPLATTEEGCAFTTTQENFQRALRVVGGVVGKNPSLPILSNVLIKSENGQLRLSATDLEVGITTWLAGKLRGQGALTVPYRTLAEYLQNLPGGPVELIIQRGSLAITARGPEPRSGEAYAVLQGETAENFPLIPHLAEGIEVTLPLPAAGRALEQVLYAMAADDTRPELAGFLLRAEGSTLLCAATDSYRLAEARLSLPTPVASPVSVIVPSRSAHELRRVLESAEGALLRIGESQLLLVTPTVQLVSRRTEGTYPDYAQVIPPRTPTTVVVERLELLRSIRAASVFSESIVSRVTLEVGSERVLVTAVTPELGETRNTLPAEVTGENLTIAFNARFLKDALQALTTVLVRIGVGGPTTPAVFREVAAEVSQKQTGAATAVSTSGIDVVALIMPIKT